MVEHELHELHERQEQVLDLARDESWAEIRRLFGEEHPADIADIIEAAPDAIHIELFVLVTDSEKPAVLSEMRNATQVDVLAGLQDSELAAIVERMAPDDAADVLANLDTARSEQALALIPREQCDEIRRLLTYDSETAGGIMTPDFVAMSQDQTAQEAIDAIAYLESDEPIFNANVVDASGVLTGYVDLWELLRERDRTKRLSELAHDDFVAATTSMDQEAVSGLLSKYDLNVIPVVDAAGRLVGRVTSDDAMEVIEEEASEDILRLGGSDDSELEELSTIRTCLVRLPWLLVTLVGGFLVSFILRTFHSYISGGDTLATGTLALAAFVPTVLAMGGNTGIQSSTLTIRSIALDSLHGRVRSLLAREISAGAIMGLCCGVLIGVWACVVTSGTEQVVNTVRVSPVQLATIVGVAMFSAMTFATIFGAAVPLILDRLGIDPAVAANPFVTIANDISALLIYFLATAALVASFRSGLAN